MCEIHTWVDEGSDPKLAQLCWEQEGLVHQQQGGGLASPLLLLDGTLDGNCSYHATGCEHFFGRETLIRAENDEIEHDEFHRPHRF